MFNVFGRTFILYYQPQIEFHLRRSKGSVSAVGRVIGAEALLRQVTDDGTIRYPSAFMDQLSFVGVEDQELITRHVLKDACRLGGHLFDIWSSGFNVGVNIFPLQLRWEAFLLEDVRLSVTRWGLPSDCLTIEVVETHVPYVSGMTTTVERHLKDLHHVAVDDFGNGGGHWRTLLPHSIIKTDRSLLRRRNTALLMRICGIARDNRQTVVIEGVETEEQLLHALRVVYGNGLRSCVIQGFYFGRPMPRDVLLKQLGSWQTVRHRFAHL